MTDRCATPAWNLQTQCRRYADLAGLFLAAVTANSAAWPAPGIVVNGLSAHRGMDWDMSGATQWLGYRQQDDLYTQISG